MTGIFGGAFDPPHLGHVELARRAIEEFELERLIVLVVDAPGHKDVHCPVETRLHLAELAFGELTPVVGHADRHAYRIDSLRANDFAAEIFLVGADQYRDFSTWKESEAILERVRLGVATRHGVDRPPLAPEHEGRVVLFEIESPPIASREIRARVARGESIDELVPPAVAREIRARGLYRS